MSLFGIWPDGSADDLYQSEEESEDPRTLEEICGDDEWIWEKLWPKKES